MQGACAWALQTMPSGRGPVGVQGERRESPTPFSLHSFSPREVRNTFGSLLPSGCCSLCWGWHGRRPEPPSCSSILPFLLCVRAGEKAGWQGCFSELLLDAPAAACAVPPGPQAASAEGNRRVPCPVPGGWKRSLGEGCHHPGGLIPVSSASAAPADGAKPLRWETWGQEIKCRQGLEFVYKFAT